MLPTSSLILFLACSNYFDFTLGEKKAKCFYPNIRKWCLNFAIAYVNLNYY